MRKRIATFENQQRVRRGLVSTMFPICALGLFLTSGTAEAAPHSEKIDVKAARSAPSFKGGASAAPESSAAASPGVQAAIQRHLNDREYWASQSSQGLQAPNRRHNLRTYFGPSGIQLVDRTAEGREELVSLRVTRFGRDEALTTVGPGEVVTEEDRVEIRRPGLVEWYVNLPEGLEQGFTLDTAPSGTGPVVVELAVSGGTVSLQGGQVTVELLTADGAPAQGSLVEARYVGELTGIAPRMVPVRGNEVVLKDMEIGRWEIRVRSFGSMGGGEEEAAPTPVLVERGGEHRLQMDA